MTNQELDEIETRANAATVGPWEAECTTGNDFQWFDVAAGGEELFSGPEEPHIRIVLDEHHEALAKRVAQHKADIELVAHARTDVPALIAEVRRLRAELDSLHLLRPLSEYHEDYGDVLWWSLPVVEEPYVGSPLCSAWPGYHTHWSRLPDCTKLVASDGAKVTE